MIRDAYKWVVLGLALAMLFGSKAPPIAAAVPASPPASLIYAGWFGNTIPTPDFIRTHQAFLETQPFSGLAVYLRDPGLTINASMQVMTNTPISYAQISFVLSPLQGLTFTNLTQNFGLVLGNAPPDFFNDWTTTTQNFSNLARAAKDAGLKGIFFDDEQYFSPWGNYPTGVLFPAKTLAEYQAQARLRGKQVMEAMVAQFPDIVVLTLHGPYVSEPNAPAPLFPQWQSANELLGPFFAGLTEGKGSMSENVDGGELYHLRSAAQFLDSYNWRKTAIASTSVNCAFIPAADRLTWAANSSIGFGVYDRPFGGADMNATILRSTLANALRQADRYVWFYAEAATYLLPPSQGGASTAWVDAIRLARADAGALPAAPDFLSAWAVSASEIDLSWGDLSSNETGFELERKLGPTGTWSLVATPAADAAFAADTGLPASTSYTYRLRAVNGSGASAYSNEAGATTPAVQPIPAAPSTLVATAVSATQVSLSWVDNSSNEIGFSIERLSGGAWIQAGSVGAGVRSYQESGLSPRTTYSYRVLAFNAAGSSATTSVVKVKTLRH